MWNGGDELPDYQLPAGEPLRILDLIANRVVPVEGGILIREEQEVGAGADLPAVVRHPEIEEPAGNTSPNQDGRPEGNRDTTLQHGGEDDKGNHEKQPEQRLPARLPLRVVDRQRDRICGSLRGHVTLLDTN